MAGQPPKAWLVTVASRRLTDQLPTVWPVMFTGAVAGVLCSVGSVGSGGEYSIVSDVASITAISAERPDRLTGDASVDPEVDVRAQDPGCTRPCS
jgi:hypothetical protein